MIAAMMLPTTCRCLRSSARITGGDATDGCRVLLVAGYSASGSRSASLAHAIDAVLLRTTRRAAGWLQRLGGRGAVLAAPGFQFSALKYRCLEECRTPFSFVSCALARARAGS